MIFFFSEREQRSGKGGSSRGTWRQENLRTCYDITVLYEKWNDFLHRKHLIIEMKDYTTLGTQILHMRLDSVVIGGVGRIYGFKKSGLFVCMGVRKCGYYYQKLKCSRVLEV